MAKQSKITFTGNTAPAAICTIPMDKDYELSEEKLKAHTDPTVIHKKDWNYPALKFISFNSGTLVFSNSWHKTSLELQIKTEPGKMQVGCSCGHTGNLLCLHSFRALARLTWTHGDGYFKKYLPGGPVDLAYRYKNLFKLEWEWATIRITNRDEEDTVYLFDTEPLDSYVKQSLQLPILTPPATGQNGLALTYIINFGFRNRIFPNLFPCLGTLNKAGSNIVGFDKFLSGVTKEYEDLHTEEQRILNLLCYDLYRRTEDLPGTIENSLEANRENLIKAFELWKQGFSLLGNQPFVFTHILYLEKDLKGKPAKTRTAAVKVQGDIPSISFLLQQKGGIYKLEMIITLNQKRVKNGKADVPFFLLWDKQIFTWSTLRDAALAERFAKFGGSIIILKEHFTEFNRTVLEPLSEFYKIEKKVIKK
jgi:hypothetical protein